MVALLLALLLAGEVTDADIETYAAKAKIDRPKAIAAAKKSLIAARRNRSLSKDDKRASAKAIQQRIELLSDKSLPFYPPLDMEAGSGGGFNIGWIGSEVQLRCRQIADETNCTVDRVTYTYESEVRNGSVVNVGPPNEHTVPYWLTGFPTSGLVDGEFIKLHGVVKVGGNKSYEAVNGANRTLRLIEFVDISPHADKFKP